MIYPPQKWRRRDGIIYIFLNFTLINFKKVKKPGSMYLYRLCVTDWKLINKCALIEDIVINILYYCTLYRGERTFYFYYSVNSSFP